MIDTIYPLKPSKAAAQAFKSQNKTKTAGGPGQRGGRLAVGLRARLHGADVLQDDLPRRPLRPRTRPRLAAPDALLLRQQHSETVEEGDEEEESTRWALKCTRIRYCIVLVRNGSLLCETPTALLWVQTAGFAPLAAHLCGTGILAVTLTQMTDVCVCACLLGIGMYVAECEVLLRFVCTNVRASDRYRYV